MPLNLMNTGEHCRICTVLGPPEVSMRLANMGFTSGTPVTVIGKTGSAVIVCVRDCRVALDGGMARCIHVEH